MEKVRKVKLTATQSLVLGFIILILIGTFLLMLPISNNDGKALNF